MSSDENMSLGSDEELSVGSDEELSVGSDEEVSVDSDEELGSGSDEYEPWYYAVANGRQLGVFTSLEDARRSTLGFSYSLWQKFGGFSEAEDFLRRNVVIVERQGQRDSSGDITWTAYDVMDADTLPIVAFCDGSAIRNGRPDCTAAYACLFPHNQAWNEVKVLSERCRATNNRAEYHAALAILKRAALADPNKRRPVVIFTDSELLINTMQDYINKWLNNGWMTVAGTPVKNRDILEQILSVGRGRSMLFRHVKAHTGRQEWEAQWNAKADEAAHSAAYNAHWN